MAYSSTEVTVKYLVEDDESQYLVAKKNNGEFIELLGTGTPLPTGMVLATGGGKETIQTVSTANVTAVTHNLANGNVCEILDPADDSTCTVTLTGATAGKSCGGTVIFHQSAAGNSQIAFAGGTIHAMNDGVLPAPSQLAGKVSFYSWLTLDGGTNIYIWKVGDSSNSTSVPGTPTIGTATAGNTEATAVWIAPVDDGGSDLTGFEINTHLADGTLVATDTVGVVLSFNKTGLSNGTGYKFTVAAINVNGIGPHTGFSNTITPDAFSPENFSNLVDWIEADEITGLSDNDPIASVTNLHSGGETYSQATGSKQPTWKASVAAFNSKPVMRFAVANAQILDTAAPVSTLIEGYTHVIVVSAASTSAERCAMFNGNRAVSGCGLYLSSGSGSPGAPGKVSILQGATAWQDTDPLLTPSSTPSIYMWHRAAGTGVTTLYINGVEAPTVSPTMASGNAPSVRSSIGGDQTFFLDGDVAVKLTYNAKRSNAELNTIGAFYAAKYGHPWTDIP